MVYVIYFGVRLKISLEDCRKYCNLNASAPLNWNFCMLCAVEFWVTVKNKKYITCQRIAVAGWALPDQVPGKRDWFYHCSATAGTATWHKCGASYSLGTDTSSWWIVLWSLHFRWSLCWLQERYVTYLCKLSIKYMSDSWSYGELYFC